MQKSQQKLRDKAELYERMAEGRTVRANPDDSAVEFLVDFGSKKRQREEERERYREQEEAEPTGFGRAPVPEHYHHSEGNHIFIC